MCSLRIRIKEEKHVLILIILILNKTISPQILSCLFSILEIPILVGLKGFKIGFLKPLTKNKANTNYECLYVISGM